ncbi:MAG: hypothetical protein ACK5Y7_02505 [Betaproteobacteria bacterium]
MTNEELDEARVRAERIRRRRFAARLAREGWTPPEPVDPDVLAFREWGAADSEADGWTGGATLHRQGHFDLSETAQAYLAGARMATEREQERAALLARCMRQEAARLRELSTINDFDETVSDGGITAGMVCRQEIAQIAQSLNDALAKNVGEA